MVVAMATKPTKGRLADGERGAPVETRSIADVRHRAPAWEIGEKTAELRARGGIVHELLASADSIVRMGLCDEAGAAAAPRNSCLLELEGGGDRHGRPLARTTMLTQRRRSEIRRTRSAAG